VELHPTAGNDRVNQEMVIFDVLVSGNVTWGIKGIEN